MSQQRQQPSMLSILLSFAVSSRGFLPSPRRHATPFSFISPARGRWLLLIFRARHRPLALPRSQRMPYRFACSDDVRCAFAALIVGYAFLSALSAATPFRYACPAAPSPPRFRQHYAPLSRYTAAAAALPAAR